MGMAGAVLVTLKNPVPADRHTSMARKASAALSASKSTIPQASGVASHLTIVTPSGGNNLAELSLSAICNRCWSDMFSFSSK